MEVTDNKSLPKWERKKVQVCMVDGGYAVCVCVCVCACVRVCVCSCVCDLPRSLACYR